MRREFRWPDPPADILERLRQIDPTLGLRFSPTTIDNWSGDVVNVGHWIVTIGWREDDRRWEMVRRQEMKPEDACDRVLDLPADCSVQEAYGYFVDNVKRWNGSKDEVTRLLSRAHHFNAKREQDILDETLAFADELIEANAPTLFQSLGKTIAKFRQQGFGRGLFRGKKAVA